jgi:hypothetical protein
MSAPAFQFYPKQWLGDDKVLLMDWDARAMHLHLMCIAWQQSDEHPCSLPDDDISWKKWCGNARNFSVLLKQIRSAWVLENGRWYQPGLLRQWEKQQRFSNSRSENANKRWEKAHASASSVQCERDAFLSSSSSLKQNNKHLSDQFNQFYKTYPRHASKAAAFKAWSKLNGQMEALYPKIMAAVELQMKTHGSALNPKGGPEFIPLPSSWINGRRWEDEIKSGDQKQTSLTPDQIKELVS